jgi:hypothetical protein
MITLSVEQLKDFQRRTQYIETNTTLPALKYVKLHFSNGKHYLTKNNLSCVCVALVKSITNLKEHEPLLLDNHILFSFVNITRAMDIEITWDERQIKLSDGRTHIKFNKEAHADFPPTPSFAEAKNQFIFTKKHLDAIAIARNFIMDTESGGNYRFIHLGGAHITAFHTNFFYVNNQFENLPIARISGEMAAVITGVEELKFSMTDRHYFFLAVDMIYIFTQTESSSPNLTNVLAGLAKPGKQFEFSKAELVDFCQVANFASQSALADCSIIPNGGTFIDFKLTDASYNRNVDKRAGFTGEIDQFNFDSKLFINPLKAVPYDTLKGKTNGGYMMIEGDKEYFAFAGMPPKTVG